MMAASVTTETNRNGDLVVAKHHLGSNDGRAEAVWLADARHPGVVRLLGRHNDPPVTLLTHITGPSLRGARPNPERAATILGDAATTLADLHDRQIVHGAIDPDHLLLGHEGTMLCSPHPGYEDVGRDSIGLGICVEFLLGHWEAEGVAFHPDWRSLHERLVDDERPLPLRRAAHRLAALTGHVPKPRPVPDILRSRGVWLLAVLLVTALGGLLAVRPDAPASASGAHRIVLDGSIYLVGQSTDVVAALPSPCADQPIAVIFDTLASELWAIDIARHGERGTLVAVLPGTTDIDVAAGTPGACPTVTARGPAGARVLDLW
jgi:hypothetical protein